MSTIPEDVDEQRDEVSDDDLADLEEALEAADEPDEDEAEADEDLGDTEHEGDAAGSAGPGAARARSGSNRALIRRVANKAGELAAAPPARVQTLASLLGCSTELPDLTYAVMTADRSALSPASDLQTIAEATAEDPFSAGVVAVGMGRTRMRSVWSLLQTLGVDVAGSIPASDAKAGVALAKACFGLPDGTRDELAAVVTLSRKS